MGALRFALGSIGAIGAAIYANSSPKDAGYIRALESSASSARTTPSAKVEEVRARSPAPARAHLADLTTRRRGRAYAAEHPDAREAREAIEENDLFTYIYTSGTTGRPRAA